MNNIEKLFHYLDYKWHSRYDDKEKYLCDPQTDEMAKYPVPTNLGMIALCAHYRKKHDFDMVFIPNIDDIYQVLKWAIEDLVCNENPEAKKVLIYDHNTSYDTTLDSKTKSHVVPLLLCKYGDRIGIFMFDSTPNSDAIKSIRYSMSDQTNVQFFLARDRTQTDAFSCRIKAIVDMRRALSLNGADDPFRDIVLANMCEYDALQIEIPAHLHKTTQDKTTIKLMSEELLQTVVTKKTPPKTLQKFLDDTSQEFKQIAVSEFGNTSKLTTKHSYLLRKAVSYRCDLESELSNCDINTFLNLCLSSCYPEDEYKEEITTFFDSLIAEKALSATATTNPNQQEDKPSERPKPSDESALLKPIMEMTK